MRGALAGSLPALLALNASRHAEQIALRYKQLGIWQVRRWAELAAEVARLAGALQLRGFVRGDELVVVSEGRIQALLAILAAQWLGGRVSLIDPAGSDWSARLSAARWLYLDLTQWLPATAPSPAWVIYAEGQARSDAFIRFEQLHEGAPQAAVLVDEPGAWMFPQESALVADTEALLNEARLLVTCAGLQCSDEVLLGSRFASSAHLRLVLLPWLITGLRLSLVETPATRHRDRREVAPSVMVGDHQQYALLHAGVVARAPLPGTLSHWLYRWAMQPGLSPSALRRAAGHWLVRGPLLDVLGLGRVRIAVLDGAALAPEPTQFFAALGIEMHSRHSLGARPAGLAPASVPRVLTSSQV